MVICFVLGVVVFSCRDFHYRRNPAAPCDGKADVDFGMRIADCGMENGVVEALVSSAWDCAPPAIVRKAADPFDRRLTQPPLQVFGMKNRRFLCKK
jgi:hypothetical protein